MGEPGKARRFGRFEIVRELGGGAQGTVYLANDPRLQRPVAIKTIHLNDSAERTRQIELLLDEAKIVGKLQHPNIVMLHDAGEEQGIPYLVFEYVEGTTLGEMLKAQGALSPNRAVDMFMGILDGIAYAHLKQVVHRDIKPGNVIVDGAGTPRIMDFGIAKFLAPERAGDQELLGTPRYMAPEYITQKTYGPQADIFSLGMLLHEMLTGQPAVTGGSLSEVLHRIVTAPIAPPSSARPGGGIDEKLDALVLKALSKEPAQRFSDAIDMKSALQGWANPNTDAPETSEESRQATIEFLLRRIRHKSDFPALSHTISTINKVVASEAEGAAALSNTILKDFALTNKLLRLVNTAFYGQFGGTISTISRAVVILGFETIRNVAITLVLFEHLQNKSQAAQLKDEIIGAFLSGVIAREVVSKSGIKDAEEGFICSMFHKLGKLLAAFYFHEEMQEVNKLIQHKGMSEEKASALILGATFEELGVGVAKAWNFPDKIVGSMRRLPEGKIRRSPADIDRLRILSGFANELCQVAANTPPEEKHKRLAELAARFSDAIPTSEKQLATVIETSVRELSKESGILNIDTRKSAMLKNIAQWSGRAEIAAPSANQAMEDAATVLGIPEAAATAIAGSTVGALGAVLLENSSMGGGDSGVEPTAVLSAGIQDITNTLVDDYSLNDVLRMILETMYRGMGFSRVLLCVRDVKSNMMNGRFGFGPDIDRLLHLFRFPLSYTPDVFHAALSQGVDIFITDVNAENIKSRIPDWYRKLIPAQSFILFPIIIDKKPIGLFYADKDDSGELAIQPKELALLKTLRNQAVLAIKQKF